MLTKDKVIEMANLFFNEKPEEAYKMVTDINEWNQFINSIKKDENQLKAYLIMAKSDLRIWEENTPFKEKIDYESFNIGY